MFQCQDHPASANVHVAIEYSLYSCGGTRPGCGTFAFIGSEGGPRGPCPGCHGTFSPAGNTRLSIGYCMECWPFGVPEQLTPSRVPVRVVGGTVPLK